MGSFSIWHWLIVLAIVLLVFGTGRVSNLMGDVAKGVKNFKKGLQEEDDDKPAAAPAAAPVAAPKTLTADAVAPADTHKDEAAKS